MAKKRNEYISPLEQIKGKLVASRENLPGCRLVDGKWVYTLTEDALFSLLDKCFEGYEEYCRMIYDKSEMYRRQLGGLAAANRRKGR